MCQMTAAKGNREGYEYDQFRYACSMDAPIHSDLHFTTRRSGERTSLPVQIGMEGFLPSTRLKGAHGLPDPKAPSPVCERISRRHPIPGTWCWTRFAGVRRRVSQRRNWGGKWVGIDISEKAVELVNMRLREFMGGLFHSRLVTARTDIPDGGRISRPRSHIGSRSTCCLVGRRGGVGGARWSSCSGYLRWTTWCRGVGEGRTTRRIFSCCARIAIGSRGIGIWLIWWLGWGRG